MEQGDFLSARRGGVTREHVLARFAIQGEPAVRGASFGLGNRVIRGDHTLTPGRFTSLTSIFRVRFSGSGLVDE